VRSTIRLRSDVLLTGSLGVGVYWAFRIGGLVILVTYFAICKSNRMIQKKKKQIYLHACISYSEYMYTPTKVDYPDSRVCICLKCGHCSQGDPIFLFLYFCPSTCFFWHFFTKLESTTLI
jgi:hypothetical protein